MGDIDWQALHDAAHEATRHAYVPYSRFPVGAAALVDHGRVVVQDRGDGAPLGQLAQRLPLHPAGRPVVVVLAHDHVDECADDSPAVVKVEVHLGGEFAGLVAEHAEDDVVGVALGVGTGDETVMC